MFLFWPIKFDFIFKIFLSFIFVIDLIIKKTMPFSSLLTVRIVTNINEITNYNTKIESNPGFFMFDLKEKKRRKRKEQGRKESKLSVLLGWIVTKEREKGGRGGWRNLISSITRYLPILEKNESREIILLVELINRRHHLIINIRYIFY